MSYYSSTCVFHKATMLPTCALTSYPLPYSIVLCSHSSSPSYMHTPCVYHEEPLSLDVTPNPNSYSRLFLILLDPKSFQTVLDSITWLPGHVPIFYPFVHCRLIITKVLTLTLVQSLSTLSYYNTGLMSYTWSFRVGCTVVSMDHGQ